MTTTKDKMLKTTKKKTQREPMIDAIFGPTQN